MDKEEEVVFNMVEVGISEVEAEVEFTVRYAINLVIVPSNVTTDSIRSTSHLSHLNNHTRINLRLTLTSNNQCNGLITVTRFKNTITRCNSGYPLMAI